MERLLLQRIADRDASAIDELYAQYSARLLGLIVRIIRDRGEAEDVLQEVFIRVWQRADSYDHALGSVSAWLHRIARNRAIDRIRAMRATRATDGAQASPDRTSTAAALPDAADGWRHVSTALAELAPEQRILIECAYFEGYTHAELADRFQLPLGTVKSRIRLGMLALRDGLKVG